MLKDVRELLIGVFKDAQNERDRQCERDVRAFAEPQTGAEGATKILTRGA